MKKTILYISLFAFMHFSCQKEEVKDADSKNKSSFINDHLKDLKSKATSSQKKLVKPLFDFRESHIQTKDYDFWITMESSNKLNITLTDSEAEFAKFCDTIQYRHWPVYERAQRIDPFSIQKDAQFVSRNGGNLFLKLKDGTTKVYTDNNVNGESSISYLYREYLKEIGYYLILVAYYEGAEYILVNDQNGAKFNLSGLPKISPDKKYIMTSSYDIRDIGGLGIWEIAPDKLNLILCWSSQGTNVVNAVWKDSENILFEIGASNYYELECKSSHVSDAPFCDKCRRICKIRILKSKEMN